DRFMKWLISAVVLSIFTSTLYAAVGIAPLAEKVLRQPDEWFKSDEAHQLCDNLVSWQNANGGWWKNYDTSKPRATKLPADRTNDGAPGDAEDTWHKVSTFDNGATYSEMNI